MSIPEARATESLPAGLLFLRALPMPRKLGILERFYGKRLACLGTATVVLANGCVWTLDLSDVTHRWLVYGDYEGALQMSWLKQWLSCGGVFIDSGSNIGQMVVSLAHLEGVQTLAFEPVSSERVWLQKCLKCYPSWPVTVFPLGLSDHKQQLMIRLAGGRSTLRTDWYLTQQLAEEPIELVTLDSFSESQGLNRIRLWKLDMEGHEVQALSGAAKLLAAKRIDALLIEAQTNTIPQLLDILSSARYTLHVLDASGVLRAITEASYPKNFNGNLIALPDENTAADLVQRRGLFSIE